MLGWMPCCAVAYRSCMERVPSLNTVDLSALLGMSLSAEARQRMVEIGSRIDLLRLPADEGGWVIGRYPPAPAGSQPLPLALGTALGRHYERSDWLELALDVWFAGRDGLLVTAAVEVACFCPVDHGMHQVAVAEWKTRSEAELLDAFDAALTKLATWSEDTASPGTWRHRAQLPPR